MALMVIYMIACACGACFIVFLDKKCFGLNKYCCKERENRDVVPIIV
jgi:hypothetical protein